MNDMTLPKCNNTASGFDITCDRLDCQRDRVCIAHANPQKIMDAMALMCGLPIFTPEELKRSYLAHKKIHDLAIQLRDEAEAKQLKRDMGEAA